MPRTRTLLALVLLPLLVFLVSCGGDDDDGGGSSANNQPSASDSSSSSNGSSSSSDTTNNSSSSDSSGSSDSNDATAAEIMANCPELTGFFGAFTSGAFANPASGGSAEADFEDTVKVFQAAADNAPNEIKGDMQVLADGLAKYFSTLSDLGVDLNNPASFATLDEDKLAQLQTALETFDNASFEEAANNVSAYVDEHCSS